MARVTSAQTRPDPPLGRARRDRVHGAMYRSAATQPPQFFLSSQGASFPARSSELLQTSSASASVSEPESPARRISYSTACPPARATCHAASHPANLPPIMWTLAFTIFTEHVSQTIGDFANRCERFAGRQNPRHPTSEPRADFPGLPAATYRRRIARCRTCRRRSTCCRSISGSIRKAASGSSLSCRNRFTPTTIFWPCSTRC